MANLPAVMRTAGKNTGILSSNQAVNSISSGKDFAYSVFSGISKMLSPQRYDKHNLSKKMLAKTNIARERAEGKITRGRDGAFNGISHIDRLKLAHMNSDGTYNKSAIAGSALTVLGGISGATHIIGGEDGVPGVPLI